MAKFVPIKGLFNTKPRELRTHSVRKQLAAFCFFKKWFNPKVKEIVARIVVDPFFFIDSSPLDEIF